MKVTPILICVLVIIFITCAKEYSRKGTIPIRTIPNELITTCDIFIEKENEIRWIYPEATTKYHPATYWIFDSIKMNGTHQYNRTYDLTNYLDMNDYSIGDTFIVRYELRWKFKPAEFVQEDTLVY